MFIFKLVDDPIFFARVVCIIILSICLHELAHGWAAISQGDDTPKQYGHMTMNPLVHMGWESMIMLCIAGIAWGQVPVNSAKFRSAKWGNILVAMAGPLSNLGLAVVAIVLLQLSAHQEFSKIISLNFLYLVAHINLILFLFNLLPLPPLDGFHVASEIFPILKPLGHDEFFGLFTLMFLFVYPSLPEGLAAIAKATIEVFSNFTI